MTEFLKGCGEPNLIALTQPGRLNQALKMLDTSMDGEMDMDEWMQAIKRGLAKRLDELADERERRERAAAAADEEFSAEFLNMARQVFDMIDADGGGTLDKAEIVTAVKENQEVIKFLSNCGNENLMYLLVPSRLDHALACLDTDQDGEITAPEWEMAIEQALKAKLEQRVAQREAQAAADGRELEAFKEQFLNAARRVL